MKRVMQGRRQSTATCPRCATPTGLWLNLLTRSQFDAICPTTDITAALSDPGDRAEVMRRTADLADFKMATPWVMCLTCGHEGIPTIGGLS